MIYVVTLTLMMNETTKTVYKAVTAKTRANAEIFARIDCIGRSVFDMAGWTHVGNKSCKVENVVPVTADEYKTFNKITGIKLNA